MRHVETKGSITVLPCPSVQCKLVLFVSWIREVSIHPMSVEVGGFPRLTRRQSHPRAPFCQGLHGRHLVSPYHLQPMLGVILLHMSQIEFPSSFV